MGKSKTKMKSKSKAGTAATSGGRSVSSIMIVPSDAATGNLAEQMEALMREEKYKKAADLFLVQAEKVDEATYLTAASLCTHVAKHAADARIRELYLTNADSLLGHMADQTDSALKSAIDADYFFETGMYYTAWDYYRYAAKQAGESGLVPEGIQTLLPRFREQVPLSVMMDACGEKISDPVMEFCFLERAAQIWDRFSGIEKPVRGLIDRNRLQSAGEKLTDFFTIVNLPVEVAKDPESGKYLIIFPVEDEPSRIWAAIRLRELMPQKIQELWEIRVGRPPRPGAQVEIKGIRIRVDRILVRINSLAGAGNEIDISLYSPDLNHLQIEKNSDESVDACCSALAAAVGELEPMCFIADFAFEPSADGEGWFPIREFHNHLPEDFQRDFEEDPLGTYLGHMRLSYTRENPWRPYDLGAARKDLREGFTTYAPLIVRQDTIVYFLAIQGIMPASFVLPLPEGDVETRKERMEEMSETLMREIDRRAGEHVWFPIGYAEGDGRYFLDGIFLDLNRGVEAARDIFREMRVPRVDYLSKHPAARPVQIV